MGVGGQIRGGRSGSLWTWAERYARSLPFFFDKKGVGIANPELAVGRLRSGGLNQVLPRELDKKAKVTVYFL